MFVQKEQQKEASAEASLKFIQGYMELLEPTLLIF
jgi:hypothetical protein